MAILALDSRYRSRYPERTSDLLEFEAHLLQDAREMPELKLWQLQGEQAAHCLMCGRRWFLYLVQILASRLPRE